MTEEIRLRLAQCGACTVEYRRQAVCGSACCTVGALCETPRVTLRIEGIGGNAVGRPTHQVRKHGSISKSISVRLLPVGTDQSASGLLTTTPNPEMTSDYRTRDGSGISDAADLCSHSRRPIHAARFPTSIVGACSWPLTDESKSTFRDADS